MNQSKAAILTDDTGHDTANVFCNLKYMGDAFLDKQLIRYFPLCDYNTAVIPPDSKGSDVSLIYGFESVF